MLHDATIRELITALGIGLMIGVVRERRHAPNSAGAGIRTHALISILGAVSWGLGLIPFTVTLTIVGVFAVSSYFFTARKDPGLTGEVTIILTFILSAFARENIPLAGGLGVLCTILIQAKDFIHRLTRELISEQELSDGLLLLASAVIVMPILPDKAIDQWGVLKLTTIWRIVILIMATGMLGHLARRTLGVRLGLPIAGFFSGFASSTAAIASMGQRAKQDSHLVSPAAASSLLANLASLLLFIGVITTVSQKLLQAMLIPFLLASVFLGVVITFLLFNYRPKREDEVPPSGQIFKLSHALFIATVIAGVSILSAWLNERYGGMGALATCILVAMAEIHAAAASLGQLADNGVLEISTAKWGVVGVLISSTVAKTFLAYFSGGKSYCLKVGLGLLAMILGALVGVVFF